MKEKLFLISDAVTENTSGLYHHKLNGEKYVLGDGTLSGSSLTMLKAVKNIVEHGDISLEEAFRMASLYPAKALGIDNFFGRIRRGYKAELLWIDNSLQIKGIYTKGNLTFET